MCFVGSHSERVKTMITKAIIPVAGWGTRRLPVTKAIEKCMLPVGNRPIVDYVVQDCISAGITDIYFVVGEQSTQLHDFYRNNVELNDYLRRNGKENFLPMIAPPKVRIHYVVQSSYGKYGTSIPVALAYEAMGKPDESVVVLMGDDCIYNADGSSEVKRLIDATPEGECAMLGVEVEHDLVSSYGVLALNEVHEFVKIVEKPTVDEAPSNLINVSKYVLNPMTLQAIYAHAQTSQVGEYYITDPINQAVSKGTRVKVIPATGKYLDAGTLEGWLAANEYVVRGS